MIFILQGPSTILNRFDHSVDLRAFEPGNAFSIEFIEENVHSNKRPGSEK